MRATIEKSRATGSLMAPPSKSVQHRYILSAALAEGVSTVSNIDLSQDITATLGCAKELGAEVTMGERQVTIKGIGNSFNVAKAKLDCNESGSTMRFLMGIIMGLGGDAQFYGSETLRKRPMDVYKNICTDQGLTFEVNEDNIHIAGKLKGGEYIIPGDISSQFITGLLFSLPLLAEDSTIKLINTIESRSYIDLTINALAEFGVKIVWANDIDLFIAGNQKYIAADVITEGDYSNAAIIDAFNFVGGDFELKGLKEASVQGDKVYKKFFDEAKSGKIEIDISDCPDLGPILMAIGAAKDGIIMNGTRRLKIKESDRGLAMQQELNKFGVETIVEENRIEVKGGMLKTPTEILDGHNDHRIVMSLCVLLSLTGGMIEGAQAVRKSYPGFFDDIAKLGIKVVLE